MNENDETPIRIIPHDEKNEHKTETRVFAREIHECYCVQPDCEFFGKHAAQGVCHTTDLEDARLFSLIEQGEKEAAATWDFYADEDSRKSVFITGWLNWITGIDELIRLRAQNARLLNRLGEYDKKD